MLFEEMWVSPQEHFFFVANNRLVALCEALGLKALNFNFKKGDKLNGICVLGMVLKS